MNSLERADQIGARNSGKLIITRSTIGCLVPEAGPLEASFESASEENVEHDKAENDGGEADRDDVVMDFALRNRHGS